MFGEGLLNQTSDVESYKVKINVICDCVARLLDVQSRIIKYLSYVELRIGNPLPDLRTSILTFHGDFIEYVTSLQPKQGLPGAERVKKLLDEISIFLALPPIRADLDTSLEACLTEAETALNSGDDLKSRNACMKVLTSLNASAHLYPRAAILLALAPSGSRDIKITYLKWGLKMIP